MSLTPVNFNEVCSCGSGHAFGVCCGKDLMRWSREQATQAKFPSPKLPSTNLGDYKLRFIRNQIIPRPLDEDIEQFVIHALRWTLGEKWYKDQESKPDTDCHVIMRWIRTRYEFLKQIEPYNLTAKDRVASPSEVMALTSLATDLHYLQLENKLPPELIDRLRSLDAFPGAQYEVAVAASLVRSGFKIAWIKGQRSIKHCEFNAIHKVTGETIAVEAKSRHRLGTLHRKGDIPSFKEIKTNVFTQYNDAIKHDPGDKPFGVFIDINVPLQADRTFFSKDWVNDLIQRIEQKGMTIFGPKPPTCISITNCSWHYDGKSPAKWPENMMIFPPNAAYAFKNPLTIEALGHSLNVFGAVPDEE